MRRRSGFGARAETGQLDDLGQLEAAGEIAVVADRNPGLQKGVQVRGQLVQRVGAGGVFQPKPVVRDPLKAFGKGVPAGRRHDFPPSISEFFIQDI